MIHTCHALRCPTEVHPSLFMCKKHWYMLTKAMRRRVWQAYVPGQEITKTPSDEYLKVTHEAKMYLARKEGYR